MACRSPADISQSVPAPLIHDIDTRPAAVVNLFSSRKQTRHAHASDQTGNRASLPWPCIYCLHPTSPVASHPSQRHYQHSLILSFTIMLPATWSCFENECLPV